jgi:hypothetical protein
MGKPKTSCARPQRRLHEVGRGPGELRVDVGVGVHRDGDLRKASRQDLADVRAWATQGYDVSERGRITADVLAACDEAHQRSVIRSPI